MADSNDNKSNTEENKKKNSILGSLISRQDPDKTYVPELKSQWQNMDRKERVKFIIGAVVGLILFITAVLITYLILSSIVG